VESTETAPTRKVESFSRKEIVMSHASRRTFLKTGLSAAVGVGLSERSRAEGETARKQTPPNIVVLYTDDQRLDALACMGNPIIQTPHLDSLAQQGVAFSNSFCTTSICCTSRATLVTGMHCERHGIVGFNQPLAPEIWRQSFPMLLREPGYRTGFVGKWGIGGPMPEEDYDFWAGYAGQGSYFEEVDGKRKHRTKINRDGALKFLDSCNSRQSFCLQVSFKAPHCLDGDPRPFHPDPEFDDLYADVEIPVPKTATEDCFKRLPSFLQESEGRVRWQIRFSTPELFQKSVKDYYRLVTGVDRAVGEIVAKLDEMGVRDNTLLFFTSDNGFFLGEHGLAGKWFMYEESIRVPLLLFDPRLPEGGRGKRVSEMVLSTDVAPTLLDYAGIPVPSRMQGRSLRPLVEGKATDWRTEWFYSHPFEHKRIPKCEGVRTKRWKYIRYIDFDPPYEQLFDLEADPCEERDLARQPTYSERLKEMRQRWEKTRKEVI